MWPCRALREHPHHPITALAHCGSSISELNGGRSFQLSVDLINATWGPIPTLLCFYSTCRPNSVNAVGHHLLTVACEFAAQHEVRLTAPREQPPSPDILYQGICLTSSCLQHAITSSNLSFVQTFPHVC